MFVLLGRFCVSVIDFTYCEASLFLMVLERLWLRWSKADIELSTILYISVILVSMFIICSLLTFCYLYMKWHISYSVVWDGIELRDHVTPALQQLHWLPVQYRITFKLCLLVHKIHMKRARSYLTDKVTATANLQSRAGLRSASTSKYQTPRTRIKFAEN